MLKLTFKNLGPVREAKLDLRPLTVIIGPNNTGKTYLAYATYALFKEALPAALFRSVHTLAEAKPTPTAIARVVESLRRAVPLSPTVLTEVFQDTSKELFREARATFEPPPLDVDALALATQRRWQGEALGGDAEFSPEVRLVSALRAGLKGIWLWPLLLPAERNAFILTYKMLASRRYRLLREGVRGLGASRVEERHVQLLREQGDIRYPTPIEDFLDFLTDAELSPPLLWDASKAQQARGGLASVASKPASFASKSFPLGGLMGPLKPSKFGQLATQLEQGVQGGQALFYQPTELGGRELRVRLDEERSLDLYNASSSIKQLAPLLLYLRHRAAEGDLLVIDEPEMNLHPEGQARLLEVLAMLANLGVYVLVTTHSPYILAHLNNLTASTTKLKSARERQAEHLYLRDRRAFLRADRVSAYEAGNGTLRDLHDPAFGIRWDTLSDVSTELQQKYFAIREQEGEKGRGRAKKKA